MTLIEPYKTNLYPILSKMRITLHISYSKSNWEMKE